jgi:dihydroorotate dehydrogenase (NAD+) catalytic subunit
LIGIGGIQSLDDVLEFLVAGASAVQIGTANFYNPGLSGRLVDELAATLAAEKLERVSDIVSTLRTTTPAPCQPAVH